MGGSGAENGAQWGRKWGTVGLKMGRSSEIPKWGAVGLKMGLSAEIPNFSPFQALKMGCNGAENGAQLGDPKMGSSSGAGNGAQWG